MNRFANALFALCFAAGLTACGGGYSGFIIPVESELNPWVAPEADDLVSNGADEAAVEDDYEDYEDEEGDDDDDDGAAAPAATPTPAAPKSAAK